MQSVKCEASFTEVCAVIIYLVSDKPQSRNQDVYH